MGKAAILLVAGYSLLLLMSGLTMGDVATQALDNSVKYYDAINVRNIAISGANMACNYVFTNPPWVFGNPWWAGTASPIQFGGGEYSVTVDSTSSIDPVTGDRRVTITATGRYRDSVHVVRVIMRPSNFAKFALYAGTTAAMAAYWETGDSVFGPVHSQGHLKVSGRPYFGGKVTTRNGVDSTSYPGGAPSSDLHGWPRERNQYPDEPELQPPLRCRTERREVYHRCWWRSLPAPQGGFGDMAPWD